MTIKQASTQGYARPGNTTGARNRRFPYLLRSTPSVARTYCCQPLLRAMVVHLLSVADAVFHRSRRPSSFLIMRLWCWPIVWLWIAIPSPECDLSMALSPPCVAARPVWLRWPHRFLVFFRPIVRCLCPVSHSHLCPEHPAKHSPTPTRTHFPLTDTVHKSRGA